MEEKRYWTRKCSHVHYFNELMCRNIEIDCKYQINAMITSVIELDFRCLC